MESFFAKIRLLPIYAIFIYTWGLTGLAKFYSGMDDKFSQDFGSSFLAAFPGLTFAFYKIAFLEVGAGAFFVISLLKCEFLPGNKKIFLKSGLWLSLAVFAILGFGLRLIQNHGGAASIFFYFGATLVAWIFVEWTEKEALRA